MPRKTRQPVRLLPHKKTSGLFQKADGEYVADIKPEAFRARCSALDGQGQTLIQTGT